MKDVLNSVDMRMLRKGDNVPNARSLPGKITIILTAFWLPYGNHLKDSAFKVKVCQSH